MNVELFHRIDHAGLTCLDLKSDLKAVSGLLPISRSVELAFWDRHHIAAQILPEFFAKRLVDDKRFGKIRRLRLRYDPAVVCSVGGLEAD